jgi:hypothetical protein
LYETEAEEEEDIFEDTPYKKDVKHIIILISIDLINV